jgi:hypothetical protein
MPFVLLAQMASRIAHNIENGLAILPLRTSPAGTVARYRSPSNIPRLRTLPRSDLRYVKVGHHWMNCSPGGNKARCNTQERAWRYRKGSFGKVL